MQFCLTKTATILTTFFRATDDFLHLFGAQKLNSVGTASLTNSLFPLTPIK